TSLHGNSQPPREIFRSVKGKTPDRCAPATGAPALRRAVMSGSGPSTQRLDVISERARVWTDFAIVLGVAAGCGWGAARFELTEWLLPHPRPGERSGVDGWAFVLVALARGMVWFALRRYHDARREVARRNEAQARLSESLGEQRRLAQRYVLLQEA